MMRSASFVAGDTQQSPTFTIGERSVITGDSGSVSGSEDEEAVGDETNGNGSKKRKRSHVKISYVWPLSCSHLLLLLLPADVALACCTC